MRLAYNGEVIYFLDETFCMLRTLPLPLSSIRLIVR